LSFSGGAKATLGASTQAGSGLLRLSYIKPLAPYNPFSAEFPHCGAQ
jgi:hypothetical protein